MLAVPELRFDHLGVVVPDLETGRRFFEQTLGVSHWTGATADPGLGVSVQFGIASAEGRPHGPAYEIITPLGDASPVATALRGGKHILNHLAYLANDLSVAAGHLREQGCYPTGEPHPAIAYGGSRVQFFVSPLRFLIELIEAPNHRHSFLEALSA